MKILPLPLLLGAPLLWGQQCPVDPLVAALNPERFHDDFVRVQAEAAEGNYQSAQLSGGVVLTQGEKRFTAPAVQYSPALEMGSIASDAVFADPQTVIRGQGVQFNLREKTAHFRRAEYYLDKQQASGAADDVHIDENQHRDQMANATWSTCNRINPDWHLQAASLTLDRRQNRAIARHMTFRLRGWPVLYLPYFSYPIGPGRQSGFLTPNLYTSSNRGLELSVPYYWNIAPNLDATTTLRPMTKQGLMTEGELRYLGERQRGQLNGAFLWNNKPHKRWHGSWQHQYVYGRWHSDLHLQQVSDVHYLNDFRPGLTETNDWFLERHWRTRYGQHWQLEVQDYQISDPEVWDKPHSKLPQLSYQNQWQRGDFTVSAQGEATHFYKRHDISGNRFNGELSADYELRRAQGYLKPRLSINGGYYQLNDGDRLYRLLPTFSLDSGLIFERNTKRFTQTLEPRLFYVYTPFLDQSAYPLFDTSNASLSWSNLFRENWFTGGDRVADNNEIRAALTTRLLNNDDGGEKLRLSLGTVQYLSRPRSRWLGSASALQDKRLLASELNYQINDRWELAGLSLYNHSDRQLHYNRVDLRFKLGPEQFISLAHRYHRDRFDQISLQGRWRFNDRWQTFFRQDYSLAEKRSFNSIAGVEYNDCCWSWRLAGKRYRNAPSDSRRHNTLYLEFIFKGLGSAGRSADALLKNEIKEF